MSLAAWVSDVIEHDVLAVLLREPAAVAVPERLCLVSQPAITAPTRTACAVS